jgi:DNA-binding winged helix-turn-helix (wHTH) protein
MDLQFGQYRLLRSERQLMGAGGPVELSARSFDILAMLLDRPDEVVAKTRILDAVWPGLVVEDNTLQVHVSALRRALGDGMIMTVHGRGYKYTGPRPVAITDGPVADPPGLAGEADPLHPMPDLSGGKKKVPVTGGCLCGEIRYQITGPAIDTSICHCRMCQKSSGAPFTVGTIYPTDAVAFTRGEPKYYRSSPFAERGFCATCGSRLVWRALSPPVTPEWGGWMMIEVGSLDNPVPNVPTWQLGVESQLPWLDLKIGHRRVRCQDSPDVVAAWAAFGLPVP